MQLVAKDCILTDFRAGYSVRCKASGQRALSSSKTSASLLSPRREESRPSLAGVTALRISQNDTIGDTTGHTIGDTIGHKHHKPGHSVNMCQLTHCALRPWSISRTSQRVTRCTWWGGKCFKDLHRIWMDLLWSNSHNSTFQP